MRRPLRTVSITAGITGAVLLGMSQTVAIAAPVESALTAPPPPSPAPAPSSERVPSRGEARLENRGPSSSRDAQATSAYCVFQTYGDYVHVSSSAFEASGHGWWVNGNCNATLAVVTVQLQQYYSDGVWRNAGTPGSQTVRSGGGAGNRATGRAGCFNGGLTGWRSVVDVDLVGLADDPGKLYTPSQNIYCRR